MSKALFFLSDWFDENILRDKIQIHSVTTFFNLTMWCSLMRVAVACGL